MHTNDTLLLKLGFEKVPTALFIHFTQELHDSDTLTTHFDVLLYTVKKEMWSCEEVTKKSIPNVNEPFNIMYPVRHINIYGLKEEAGLLYLDTVLG